MDQSTAGYLSSEIGRVPLNSRVPRKVQACTEHLDNSPICRATCRRRRLAGAQRAGASPARHGRKCRAYSPRAYLPRPAPGKALRRLTSRAPCNDTHIASDQITMIVLIGFQRASRGFSLCRLSQSGEHCESVSLITRPRLAAQ